MTMNLKVTPRERETPEAFIRRFGKKVTQLRILRDFHDRSHFEKPSAKRRRKRNRSIRRLTKQ